MPASAQILVGHGLPLLERMSRPRDIALLNFGAWHGSGDGPEFRKLVEEFRDAVADRAGQLPRIVWKEMVPTHYDQQHGLYPGRPATPALRKHGLHCHGTSTCVGLAGLHATTCWPQRSSRACTDGLGPRLSSYRMHITACPTVQADHPAAVWLTAGVYMA